MAGFGDLIILFQSDYNLEEYIGKGELEIILSTFLIKQKLDGSRKIIFSNPKTGWISSLEEKDRAP